MGNLEQDLMQNVYPGRGIVIGRSADGKNAVIAYFIMGRSVNSRNRIFVEDGEGIRTQAFDPSKVEDPSLIIYAPVRVYGERTIVTNGDQTDTVYDGLEKGLTFEQSLRERMFEPDAPNYTPRISGLVHVSDGCFDYQMSILKSDQGDTDCCVRYTFEYTAPKPGQGRFIHTYQGDGNPLPSYEGEPFAVKFDEEFTADVETFAQRIWNALNADNRVSLFCRFIEIESGKTQTCIINCHE